MTLPRLWLKPSGLPRQPLRPVAPRLHTRRRINIPAAKGASGACATEAGASLPTLPSLLSLHLPADAEDPEDTAGYNGGCHGNGIAASCANGQAAHQLGQLQQSLDEVLARLQRIEEAGRRY